MDFGMQSLKTSSVLRLECGTIDLRGICELFGTRGEEKHAKPHVFFHKQMCRAVIDMFFALFEKVGANNYSDLVADSSSLKIECFQAGPKSSHKRGLGQTFFAQTVSNLTTLKCWDRKCSRTWNSWNWLKKIRCKKMKEDETRNKKSRHRLITVFQSSSSFDLFI